MTPNTARTLAAGFPAVAIATSVIWLVVALGACQPEDQSPCGECPPVETCNENSGRCEPTGLPEFEREAPARSLAVVYRQGGPWMAAIAPDQRRLVAGPIGASTSALRSLANVPASSATNLAAAVTNARIAPRQAGTDSSTDVFAVAWLTADRQYRIALHDGEHWRRSPPIETAELDGYAGSPHLALAANRRGQLRLIFRDPEEDGLFILAEPTPPNNEWENPSRLVNPEDWRLDLIDDGRQTAQGCQTSTSSDRNMGLSPSVRINESTIHVVYQDGACSDLRYAARTAITDPVDPPTWSIELIATGDGSRNGDDGGLGQFSDIGVNSEGHIAVAYSDQTEGRLYYAVRRAGVFESTTVDRGSRLGAFSQRRKHLVGAFLDLAFTQEGTALIGYMDATDNRARVARRSPGADSWIHQSVDLPPPTGFYNVLVDLDGEWRLYTERKLPTNEGLTSRLQSTGIEVLQ